MSDKIEHALVGGDRYEIGQRVCIVGRGTANLVHVHGRVKRFTKTMMFVAYTWKTSTATAPGERRYRTGPRGGREVGASEYGGTYVSPRCQRPKAKQ